QFICCFSFLLNYAQSPFEGIPVVGAVTSESATIYVRNPTAPMSLQVNFSLDSSFTIFDSVSAMLDVANFNSVKIQLQNLEADKKYFYRIKDVAADTFVTDIFRFRTFPESGTTNNVRLIVGSCNYNNMPGGGQGNPNFKN